jgi:hypothetical protein
MKNVREEPLSGSLKPRGSQFSGGNEGRSCFIDDLLFREMNVSMKNRKK